MGSVDFESCPPHSHPVSSLRPRLASLFWASRNCWRAFARGTSYWKTCSLSGCWWSCECRTSGKCNCWTVERTICECRKKATRIKVVKHLAILELQQFRMMQLPIIIDDILHQNLQVSVWLQMARHEMHPSLCLTLSKLSHLPRLQVSPSISKSFSRLRSRWQEYQGI